MTRSVHVIWNTCRLVANMTFKSRLIYLLTVSFLGQRISSWITTTTKIMMTDDDEVSPCILNGMLCSDKLELCSEGPGEGESAFCMDDGWRGEGRPCVNKEFQDKGEA